MSTWTNQTKSAAPGWATATKSGQGVSINPGQLMGILGLTYATTISAPGITWTTTGKSTSTWTTQTKEIG